ncbi:MAG: cytochrome bd biosynthesis protein [Burkholderiales bacterium]|nr:cytochrome bd biosynthesis protein [Burkholderiales bacterium]
MRILSFIFGLAVCGVILFYPRLIAVDMRAVPYGWLVCTMIGVSLCFVYGSGLRIDNKILRTIFSPWVAWPVLFFGIFMVLRQSPFFQ